MKVDSQSKSRESNSKFNRLNQNYQAYSKIVSTILQRLYPL